jgi:hypothetical protein
VKLYFTAPGTRCTVARSATLTSRKRCPTCYKMGVVSGDKFYCTKGCGAVHKLNSEGEAHDKMVFTGRR